MITESLGELQKLNILPLDFEKAEQESRNIEYNKLCSFLSLKANRSIYSSALMKYNKKYFYDQQLITTYLRYNNSIMPSKTVINNKKTDEYIQLEKKAVQWFQNYNNSLNKKIDGAHTRWGDDIKLINYKLFHDNDYRKEFAKDPTRQTLHQHLVANWIKQLPCIENFQEPENHGKNAYYIYHGKIVKGSELEDDQLSDIGKSIDFIWEYTFNGKILKFYATHKHTKISGGSQDNQFEDVCIFHKNSVLCEDPNIILLSITDGDYYLNRFSKYKNENLNKIEYLNKEYQGMCNRATNSEKLINTIIPMIIDWLQNTFKPEEIKEEISKMNTIFYRFMENN